MASVMARDSAAAWYRASTRDLTSGWFRMAAMAAMLAPVRSAMARKFEPSSRYASSTRVWSGSREALVFGSETVIVGV